MLTFLRVNIIRECFNAPVPGMYRTINSHTTTKQIQNCLCIFVVYLLIFKVFDASVSYLRDISLQPYGAAEKTMPIHSQTWII